MGPKEGLLLISKLETSIDEPNLRFCGVDCWPIVRNLLLTKILSAEIGQRKGSKEDKISFKNILISIFSLFFLEPANTFFLSSKKFTEKIENKKYLKDIDSLGDKESKDNSTLLGLLNGSVDRDLNVNCNIVSLYGIIVISGTLSRIPFLTFFAPDLKRYLNSIFSELERLEFSEVSKVSNENFQRYLARSILFCVIASYIFSILLRRIEAKLSYMHCYYSLMGMSLCAASNRLGMPAIDIQHGVSGRNMRAYGRWGSCPEVGYNTLPSDFWVWTPFDAEAIDEWAAVSKGAHKSKVTGNLWRSYLVDEGILERAADEWFSFEKRLSQYDLRVTVTLQFSQLEPKVLRLIEESGENICFLIRLHPDYIGFLSDLEVNKIAETNRNVFIKEPSCMPIQLLMKIADLNITEWSASVYDAYLEDKKSIVLTRNGYDYFEKFIDSGHVVFLNSFEKLKNEIEKIINT
jgi:hypothetical protein